MKRAIAFGLLMSLLGTALFAQDNTCPAIVEEALNRVDQLCDIVGRNQVCYGNQLISVEHYPGCEVSRFSSPGDQTDITAIQSLHLHEMNMLADEWGIAVMKVQANIPNSLPGQNATILLFGDVDVHNAIRPIVVGQIAYVHTTEGDDLNVRSGPGLSFAIVETLRNGTTVNVLEGPQYFDGFEWWQIQVSGVQGWVVQDVDDNNFCLTTLTRDQDVNLTSMQAFYFRSGIGDAPCEAAPNSGILVQTPSGLQHIHFLINEVQMTFSSTAFIQAEPGGEMTIDVLEGQVVAEAFAVSQTANSGERIRVKIDSYLQATQPPNQPESFDLSSMQRLPLALLPQYVNISPYLSTQPQLGMGDVQVTLRWDNNVDMDLYVSDPENETISYSNRYSMSGGQLDVDSNYPCGNNNYRVENIFWETGTAPRGTYRVWVKEYDRCGEYDSTNWHLEIRIDDQIVMVEDGIGNSQEFVFRH